MISLLIGPAERSLQTKSTFWIYSQTLFLINNYNLSIFQFILFKLHPSLAFEIKFLLTNGSQNKSLNEVTNSNKLKHVKI